MMKVLIDGRIDTRRFRRSMRGTLLGVLSCFVCADVMAGTAIQSASGKTADITSVGAQQLLTHDRLFERNKGQADPAVRYRSRSRDDTVDLTHQGAVIGLHADEPFERPSSLRQASSSGEFAKGEKQRLRLEIIPLTGASLNASWSHDGTGVQEWWVYAGSGPGTSDLFNGGTLGTATSATASNLPADGSMVHLPLWHLTGSIWQYESHSNTSNQ